MTDPFTITDAQHREVMARAVALASEPRRNGMAWRNLLKAIAVIQPDDGLDAMIDTLDYELGLTGVDDTGTLWVKTGFGMGAAR